MLSKVKRRYLIALFIAVILLIKCHSDTARGTEPCRGFYCRAYATHHTGMFYVKYSKYYGRNYTTKARNNPRPITTEGVANFHFELELQIGLGMDYDSTECICK